MGRMKRSMALSEARRSLVIDEITKLHRVLTQAMPDIQYGSPDAVALSALNEALHLAIHGLTGRQPSWMDPAPAANVWCGVSEKP